MPVACCLLPVACCLLHTDYGREIWSPYETAALFSDTVLTGQFKRIEKPTDLKAVMRVIDAARDEEAARLARMHRPIA